MDAMTSPPPPSPPQLSFLEGGWDAWDTPLRTFVVVIGGIVVLVLFILICMFLFPPGRPTPLRHIFRCLHHKHRRAIGVKRENRFDGALFFWVMCYLGVSAAWLRLIPQGDSYGRGITYPMWMEDRPAMYVSSAELQPEIDNFRMAVLTNPEHCDYTVQHTNQDYCGASNPVIDIVASVDDVRNINRALTLTIHSSGNFEWWQQSSTPILPRDLVANRSVVANATVGILTREFSAQLENEHDGYSISTKACFGPPGAYYVVGCLREGVPPRTGSRPTCAAPPCPGTVGPPFSTCLAIATACVSTCGSLARETAIPPICDVNGTIPISEIEKYAQPFGVLDPPFVGFIICYTVGLIYFFVMFMPGCGMVHGSPPAWEIFVSAAKDGGDSFVVPLQRARVQNANKRHIRRVHEPSGEAFVPMGARKSVLQPRQRLYSVRTTDQLDRGTMLPFNDLISGNRGTIPRPPLTAPSRSVAMPPSSSPSASAAPGAAQPALSALPSSAALSTQSSAAGGIAPGSRRGSYAQFRKQSVRASVRFLPVADMFDREVEMLEMAETFEVQAEESSRKGVTFGPNVEVESTHAKFEVGGFRGARHGSVRPSTRRSTYSVPYFQGSEFKAARGSCRGSVASATGAAAPPVPPQADGEAGGYPAGGDVEAGHTSKSLLTDDSAADGGPASAPIASNRAMGRGAWEHEERANLNGCTTVVFSISASEGPNTILRNALGKICSSLELCKQLKQTPGWHVVDGFADEGHRIGAYYLCRALWLAFYQAMHPSVALKLASVWLDKINEHKNASNIDKFDKEKDTQLFELLSDPDQARPEICYVRFFFDLFRPLNGFTVPVDDLFDFALLMPFCKSAEYASAYEHVRERLASDDWKLATMEQLLESLQKATGIKSSADARVILNACIVQAQAQTREGAASPADAAEDRTKAFSISTLMSDGLRAHARAQALAEGFDEEEVDAATAFEDEEDAEAISFFSPEFVREFGVLLGQKDVQKGLTERKGELQVPLDTAAYIASLSALAAEPLSSKGFQNLSPTLPRAALAKLQLSTKKRWLAYDHIGVLPAPGGGGAVAIYIARGRPDLWKPETKVNHRRCLEPGVWACRTPLDESDAEFWQSRRELALVHGIAPPRRAVRTHTLAERKKKNDDYYNNTEDAAEDDGEVVAHFFADTLTNYAAGGADSTVGGFDGHVGRKRLSELKVLNTHLGKAGGLNFGLEAILHSDIVPQPSATNPLFFGIIDARHNCDARFWKHVLPTFFEVHEIDDQVVFNPNVVLCQVPHSYIGMKASTDKLDVQNNFFFGGMAIFRDRCNGMTSAGTGGIWSLTTHENIDDFFFGRTMIEDTTSTHKYFLQGFYSKYLPPLRTSKQLMRAVPKVSANYLEALERWDTGAVQSLLTQGLPRVWFWFTLAFLLAIFAAVIAPALTTGHDVYLAVRRPWDGNNLFSAICVYYSAAMLLTLTLGTLSLSVWSPSTLNWLLRFLICYFNVTYPFTSVFGLFWMSIPPYVAIMAQFPFRLDAISAIVGSLILKMVEFSAVSKLQDASNLDEASIAMTQKMDKVTLPIKMRAIYKGFITGYADRYHRHDNSWWTSFGTSGALLWVRRWLLLVTSVMSATALIALVQIIVKATQGLSIFMEGVLPLSFAMLTGLHYVWLCIEPFRFVMKGGSLDVAPRWAEVAITAGMLIGVVCIGNLVVVP